MSRTVTAEILDGKVVFRGTGTALLRTKAEVSRIVGIPNIHSVDRTCFEVNSTFADRLASYLGAESFATPLLASADAHRAAREEVSRISVEVDQGDVGEVWDSILDMHQKVAVHAMITQGLRGLCLFDEQGSGKTVMALAAFDLLRQRGEVDLMVVVCPKSMLSEWQKDAARLMPGRYRLGLIEGNPSDRRAAVLSDADALVLGYEAVDSVLTPLKAVCGARRTLLVADESFYAKNRDAVRSKAVRELRRHCRRAFVLCGTPAPNGAVDLVHQFDLADDGYTFSDLGADDHEVIRQMVEDRGTYIRRLKRETLPHLPEKGFHLLRVPLEGHQAALYKSVRDELSVWLRSMDNRSFEKRYTDYLARRVALLQICACPHEVDSLFVGPHAKLGALDGLLDGLIRREGKKAVVWSFYRPSLRELLTRYGHYGAVLVDGSVSSPDRRAAVIRFQEDPAVRLFIGNPAACGAGITLTAAADAIYVSLSNQAAHFLQSLDRIHRRGQTAEAVDYHLIICQNTLEENELVRLRRKELMQGDLLGDVQDPISLDEALAELSDAP